jgi:hypothetical protein
MMQLRRSNRRALGDLDVNTEADAPAADTRPAKRAVIDTCSNQL